MVDKDDYITKAKARMDQWNADIDKLKAKAAEAAAKIKEIAEASDDAWQEMQAGFDTA